MLNLKTVSALAKVLPKYSCDAQVIKEITALDGEEVSFQIAFSSYVMGAYGFKVECDEQTQTEVFLVKNVPVGIATYPSALNDKNYISHEPCFLPNLLEPFEKAWVQINDLWQSMWFKVKASAGVHKIKVTFENLIDKTVTETEIIVNILDAKLPEQKLIYTQWFHCDCIASYYKYDMFSPEHWQMIEKFLRLAYKNGINMILTPIFTPPLDTQVGGERPTAQLMKVNKTGNEYKFDFSQVKRWIKLCKEIGFKYFEMPHLFTQWGAEATPKIVAEENGAEKRIFGWDVAADSYEYDNFLSQMLPCLQGFLKEEGIFDNTYFHISDEPKKENLESYSKAKNIADKYLKGCKLIEAISDTELYELGYAQIPVPPLYIIKDWVDLDLNERWCYYCCGDVEDVSNRFVAMPSARNRSIGVQMYKYKTHGFLHWGYNFYYSQYSRMPINPFVETDAHGAFPSGDAFSVYPGKDGPLPTISLFVFNDALQDMRAFNLLESYIGYDAVIKLIEDTLGEEVSFYHCYSADALLKLRETVNKKIIECKKV